MRTGRLLVPAVLAAAVLSGCGEDTPTAESTTSASSSPAAEEPTRSATKDGVTVTACGPAPIDTMVELKNAGKEKADISAVVKFLAPGGDQLGTAAAATKALGPGKSATTRVTPVGEAQLAAGSFTCEVASVTRKTAK